MRRRCMSGEIMLTLLSKFFDRSSLIKDTYDDSPFIVKGEYLDNETGAFYTYSKFTVKHHSLLSQVEIERRGIMLFHMCVRKDGEFVSIKEIEEMDFELFQKILSKIV